jgi:hypothetical protein
VTVAAFADVTSPLVGMTTRNVTLDRDGGDDTLSGRYTNGCGDDHQGPQTTNSPGSPRPMCLSRIGGATT